VSVSVWRASVWCAFCCLFSWKFTSADTRLHVTHSANRGHVLLLAQACRDEQMSARLSAIEGALGRIADNLGVKERSCSPKAEVDSGEVNMECEENVATEE
jgi:hypothetical protein